MNFTPEQEQKILAMAAEAITERIWGKIESVIEEVTCVSVPRAAGMLDLSTPQARRVFEETIDLSPRDTRISLASLKRVISAKTTKKGVHRKKGGTAIL